MKPGATVLDDDAREHQYFLEWLLWQRFLNMTLIAPLLLHQRGDSMSPIRLPLR